MCFVSSPSLLNIAKHNLNLKMKLDRDRWWTFFSIDQTNMRFSISDFCFFCGRFSESTKFSKLTLICRQILSGILEKLVWTHISLSSISQNPAFDIQKTKAGHPKDQVVFCHLHRRIHFSIDQIGWRIFSSLNFLTK